MTQLTDKNHIIVFKDFSTKLISKKIADFIWVESTSGRKGFRMLETGEQIMYASISTILPLEEYYEQYPDKRPQTPNKFPDQVDMPVWKRAKTKRAKEQLLKGYEDYKIETHGDDKWETMKASDELYKKIKAHAS